VISAGSHRIGALAEGWKERGQAYGSDPSLVRACVGRNLRRWRITACSKVLSRTGSIAVGTPMSIAFWEGPCAMPVKASRLPFGRQRDTGGATVDWGTNN